MVRTNYHQTPWTRIGVFFFSLGAGYEFLVIKGGLYESMRKAAAREYLEKAEERKQWIEEWEKKGLWTPTTHPEQKKEEEKE